TRRRRPRPHRHGLRSARRLRPDAIGRYRRRLATDRNLAMTALPGGYAPHRDPDDDTLRLECGVCGVWGAPDDEASSIVALGLHALQHRGQEACGIASVKNERFHTERHTGLVGEAFGGADLSTRMPG